MQARLKEAESQCALKEMQDKILDMEKVGYLRHDALLQSCFLHPYTYVAAVLKDLILTLLPQRNTSLPDDTNVARLQEELIGVKLREAEALTGLKELRQQVRDLEEHWQVSTCQHTGQCDQHIIFVGHFLQSAKRGGKVTDCNASPQRHLARTAGRWKDSPRKNALSEMQDELMSVRLREAEAQAELRETRQRMLEMETQVRSHTSFLNTLNVCHQIDDVYCISHS